MSDQGRAELALTLAVMDEDAGASRAVVLRRAGRTVVLRSETRLSSDGADVAVELQRFTVIEAATWGVGLRTDASWLASRLGFLFALGSESWPREGMAFAVLARGGVGLTLAASADFGAHLVLGADLALESWDAPADRFRGGVGAFVEAALPLGCAVRWRLTARLRPVWAFDRGLALGAEVETAFDLTLDGDRGLLLRPSLGARTGLPAGNGLRVGLALVF
ncbi:MAG: hypothetical protein U1F43_34370 [Myxococcota bacterium]